MTAAAVVVSLLLRFDEGNVALRMGYAPWLLPFVAYAGIVYWLFRLYQSKWRFASLPDLAGIVKAAGLLAMTLLVIDYVVVAPNLYGSYFFGRQAIVIYLLVQATFLGGPRLAYRYWKDSRTRAQAGRLEAAAPALLVGRASDVDMVVRAAETGAAGNLAPRAILSPRPGDVGQSIRGIPVVGPLADLERVVAEFELRGTPIRRIVLTPAVVANDAEPQKLLERARQLGVAVLRLQPLEGGGGAALAPVEIEDLLLRPSVAIDHARVASFVAGRRFAVTGGGGSIGQEICLRLAAFGAGAILVLEHSEPALHAVTETLGRQGARAEVAGHLCDIRDATRLRRLMGEFRPDVVFHAAALKHVPYLERDWTEAVKTNVFGSVNVAEAAVEAGAASMVMISTDKAIQPVSMLGATKRFAEMVAEALDRAQAGTRLISVRFGNVLGSNGSVVPKFKAQIAHGGPVTVTHPDMIRYFMTVREACDLVLTAAAHSAAAKAEASVYVLKMGQPVRIVDLAERMIRLSGFEPGRDIPISFTGPRPGERLHEILFDADESMVETGLDGIMAARTRAPSTDEVQGWLDGLRAALLADDARAADDVFREAIADFRPETAALPG